MNADNKYFCESCNYSTDKKSNISNHEKSKKHLMKVNGDICIEVTTPRNNDLELKLKEQEIYFTNIINKLTVEVEVLKAKLECKEEFIEFLKSQPAQQVVPQVPQVIQVPQVPQVPQVVQAPQHTAQPATPSPPPLIIKKKAVKPVEPEPPKEEPPKLTKLEELNEKRGDACDNDKFLTYFKDDNYNENYIEVIEDSSGNDMIILKKARYDDYPSNFEKIVVSVVETVMKNVEPNDRPIFYAKKSKEFYLKEKTKWVDMDDKFITRIIRTVYGNLIIAHNNTRQNIKQLYKHFGFPNPNLFLDREDEGGRIRLCFDMFERSETSIESIDRSLDPKFIEKVKSVLSKVCVE